MYNNLISVFNLFWKNCQNFQNPNKSERHAEQNIKAVIQNKNLHKSKIFELFMLHWLFEI